MRIWIDRSGGVVATAYGGSRYFHFMRCASVNSTFVECEVDGHRLMHHIVWEGLRKPYKVGRRMYIGCPICVVSPVMELVRKELTNEDVPDDSVSKH